MKIACRNNRFISRIAIFIADINYNKLQPHFKGRDST